MDDVKGRFPFLVVLALAPLVVRADSLSLSRAWTNVCSVIGISDSGGLATLREVKSGRELLRCASPVVQAKLKDGTLLRPSSCRVLGGDRVVCGFDDGSAGAVTLSVRSEKWGLVFKTESSTLKNVDSYVLCQLWPACNAFGGLFLNMLSDADSGVVLRAYDLDVQMAVRGNAILETTLPGDVPFPGHEVAIVAAPRGLLTKCLKHMTLDAKAPVSKVGGAWSLEAPENRGSYLFSYVTADTADAWIDICRRGGFSTLHFEAWQALYGHYDPSPKKFPNGWADVADATRKAKAAGLRTSFHTLTALISRSDPWISPQPRDDLMTLYTYTLASPLGPNATEIVVNECPGPRHDLVTSYFSNGNFLKIGNELVQYTHLRRDRPFAFSGLTRGAAGSTRFSGSYPAGTKVDYLFMHFGGFFPATGSRLLREMSTLVGENLRKVGADFVYQDGAEPFARRQVDEIRRAFYEGVGSRERPVQIEASCQGAHSWWFHSRVGAMDYPLWGMKRFHDRHLMAIERQRKGDLMSTLTGWWSLRTADANARGHFIDELEYFAAKNAIYDTATAILGVRLDVTNVVPYSVARQLAVFSWYERARLAGAFDPRLLERLKPARIETRLRQDETGTWTLSAGRSAVHRVDGDFARRWTMKLPGSRSSLLRVEALYGLSPQEKAETLVAASSAGNMEVSASPDVRGSVDAVPSEHGRAFRLVATNGGTAAKGAWVRAKLDWPHPYRKVVGLGTRPVLSFWVKGDGSGAILNLQPVTPRIFVGARSEHYVRLDFTGWRRFERPIRERDAEDFDEGGWNYYHPYEIFRNPLRLDVLSEFNFYLGAIPAGGKTDVLVSEVRIGTGRKVSLNDVSVTLNGERVPVPFPLVSGEFAELDGGAWIRYAENGDPLERRSPAAAPELVSGENTVAFEARPEPSDAMVRAEVTVLAYGKVFPAYRKEPLPETSRNFLKLESMEPVMLRPAAGFDGKDAQVRVRPGEAADLDFVCQGPVNGFRVLGVNFPQRLRSGERLELKGRHWRHFGVGGRVFREGDNRRPLTVGGGTSSLKLTTDDAQASARIDFIKRYR